MREPSEPIVKTIEWRAVLLAALAAGTVFLIVNLAMTYVLYDMNPALSIRYIASLVMGDTVLTSADTTSLIVGVLVHFGLSLLFTLIITIVVHRWGLLVGIVGGGLLGVAIYAINLYTLTLAFPWFFAMNGTAWLLSHLFFGMVAGGVYEMFDHYDLPLIAEEKP